MPLTVVAAPNDNDFAQCHNGRCRRRVTLKLDVVSDTVLSTPDGRLAARRYLTPVPPTQRVRRRVGGPEVDGKPRQTGSVCRKRANMSGTSVGIGTRGLDEPGTVWIRSWVSSYLAQFWQMWVLLEFLVELVDFVSFRPQKYISHFTFRHLCLV